MTASYKPRAPQWTLPATPGLFSNKYATPETFTVHCTNTGGTQDPIGQARINAVRLSDGVVLWDTTVGNPTTTPLPVLASGFGGQIVVGPQGALTVLSSVTPDVFSCQTFGGSNGTWVKQPYAQVGGTTPQGYTPRIRSNAAVTTAVVLGVTYIYVIGGDDTPVLGTNSTNHTYNNCFYARLYPDGTVGPFAPTNYPPYANSYMTQPAAISWTAPNGGQYLYSIGGITLGSAVRSDIFYTQINPDGSLVPWFGTNSLNVARYGHSVCIVGGALFALGGSSTFGGTPLTSCSFAVIASNGQVGTSSVAAGVLATGVRYPQSAFVPIALTNGDVLAILIGGYNGTSNIATIQSTVLSSDSAVFSNFTTSGSSLPVAGNAGGAGYTITGQTSPDGVKITLWVLTGQSSTLYSAPLPFTYPSELPGTITFSSGSGSALVTANMGAGGSVVTNNDGSQDLTFLYGFQGTVVAPTAGDSVALSCVVGGRISGNASPLSSTGVRFGDAPTIGSVNWTQDGNPVITFSFVQGAGGGPQQQWQARLIDISANVLADSGLVYGSLNTFACQPSTRLVSGSTYTATAINATSTDLPYPGSTNLAPPNPQTYVLAGVDAVEVPTFTATPDNVNAAMVFAITNPPEPSAPTAAQAPTPTKSGSGSTLTTGNPYWVAVAFNDASGLNSSGALLTGSVTLSSNGQNVVQAVTVPAGDYASITVYILKAASSPAFSALHAFASVSTTTGAVTYAGTNSSGVAASVSSGVVTITLSKVDNGSGGSPLTTTSYPLTNRIYYRPTGTTAWTLLKNVPTGFVPGAAPTNTSAPNPPSGVVNVTLYDQIGLNVPYDFAVSSVADASNNHGESALSAVASAQITPVTGSQALTYTASIHLAGQGPALHAVILYETSPQYSVYIAKLDQTMYATVAPSTRYGTALYRALTVDVWFPTPATVVACEAVLTAAQQQGVPIYWRDAFGAILVCSVDDGSMSSGSSSTSATRVYQYEAPTYQRGTLKLKATNFTYTP
jgi:hypothetical protein